MFQILVPVTYHRKKKIEKGNKNYGPSPHKIEIYQNFPKFRNFGVISFNQGTINVFFHRYKMKENVLNQIEVKYCL